MPNTMGCVPFWASPFGRFWGVRIAPVRRLYRVTLSPDGHEAETHEPTHRPHSPLPALAPHPPRAACRGRGRRSRRLADGPHGLFRRRAGADGGLRRRRVQARSGKRGWPDVALHWPGRGALARHVEARPRRLRDRTQRREGHRAVHALKPLAEVGRLAAGRGDPAPGDETRRRSADSQGLRPDRLPQSRRLRHGPRAGARRDGPRRHADARESRDAADEFLPAVQQFRRTRRHEPADDPHGAGQRPLPELRRLLLRLGYHRLRGRRPQRADDLLGLARQDGGAAEVSRTHGPAEDGRVYPPHGAQARQ